MKVPIVIINFKTYQEATGERAVGLSRVAKNVMDETGISIIVCPQTADIYRVSSQVSIPVFAQHLDCFPPGSHTGHISALSLRENGASGTLINHSERRLQLADIDGCIHEAKRAGLLTVVCTNNPSTTRAAAALNPDFIAIEPPELIGTGIPVSRANPEIVSGAVDAVKSINRNVKVVCGAGISKAEDFKAAIDLGTEGILLASGVVKAKDQGEALRELVKIPL